MHSHHGHLCLLWLTFFAFLAFVEGGLFGACLDVALSSGMRRVSLDARVAEYIIVHFARQALKSAYVIESLKRHLLSCLLNLLDARRKVAQTSLAFQHLIGMRDGSFWSRQI